MKWAPVIVCLVAAACGNGTDIDEDAPAPEAALQVGAENVIVVQRDRIVRGPVISGELRAARQATVRAELSGPIVAVAAEEGETVRRGALLARIEARQLDAARRSSESAVRNAERQVDVAARELARTQELVEAGALARRDLDLAQANLTAAEAQLADARARLAESATELARTAVYAPITGIVSDRAVGVGDVVSPGTALFTIIDPSSVRLEASVPSSAVGDVRPGVPVQFTVRGYDRTFEGRIERVNPQADPATRQVSIHASVDDADGRLIAGLFADGRIVVDSAEGPVVPANAVRTDGNNAWVLRVTAGVAERVDVALGLRDELTERVLISQGVMEGDVLLRGPAQEITPGTAVRVASAN